jgi:hypothetical protein
MNMKIIAIHNCFIFNSESHFIYCSIPAEAIALMEFLKANLFIAKANFIHLLLPGKLKIPKIDHHPNDFIPIKN